MSTETVAKIRAEERERIARLAEAVGATFRSTYSFAERQRKTFKFADLIREDAPETADGGESER